jgi:hypothetical protein
VVSPPEPSLATHGRLGEARAPFLFGPCRRRRRDHADADSRQKRLRQTGSSRLVSAYLGSCPNFESVGGGSTPPGALSRCYVLIRTRVAPVVPGRRIEGRGRHAIHRSAAPSPERLRIARDPLDRDRSRRGCGRRRCRSPRGVRRRRRFGTGVLGSYPGGEQWDSRTALSRYPRTLVARPCCCTAFGDATGSLSRRPRAFPRNDGRAGTRVHARASGS